MKIKYILALSLAFTSYNTLAFVSQPIATNAVGSIQAETIAGTITNNFYGHQQAGTSQAISVGSCSATPVTGCNCQFCAMLRCHMV